MSRRSDYPEVEICSRCHEHTAFTRDEDDGDWQSVCCGAQAISVDVEPDDL